MKITEQNAEREAARLEAKQALTEYADMKEAGADAYGYGDAALNVWQDKLDEWEESMR